MKTGEGRLVQRDQLAPGALGVGLAVNRTVSSRHVGHAPAVLRWIDFDLGWNLRGRKRLFQLVLRVRLALIVVLRDTEIHASLDLRRKQMRAVRLVGDETTAVERRACADAIGNRRGGLDDQRTAHAVALRADLLRFVDLRLRIQERDVGHGILLARAWSVHRRHQRLQLRHVGLILEAERPGVVELRRFRHAIERIRHQHRISFGGNPLADVAHRRAQAERIRPDQHARMGTARRMNEGGVACAVGRFDRDVGLDNRQLRGRRRCAGGGKAGQRHRDEVAP
jgi:hypothetical protein